ncbi:Sb-PDE family phosphodiesterase [Danxiaibacter flavus]|uniref:Sb-PDE family phosphodiesterase n=1 Tax=Danxiaibacter flavus TaxID=3049108 RepID=A0ABV3ZL18_9BACT|nr:Sb-PDE family phosphodiesterase [Chitinophagaceae bacterium DXS]
MIKSIVAGLGVLAISLQLNAQEEEHSRKMNLPDVPGYYTLKCDFHMHTVFSDGHVWPSFRVNEAQQDGLDAISLTEHIDYEGHPDEITRNYNRSYEIARASAAKSGLLIVRGAEISPRVPPYHNNALFLSDANIIPSPYMKDWKKKFVMKDSIAHDELMAPFLAVQKQDAFVSYNHPGYSWWDKKDTSIFTAFHKELLEKKILKGVEVVNSGVYNIIAHRIAMQYNLTMLCNTDEHYDMYARYYKSHRPVTLVFAKEKTEAAIKEALEQKRTALYFGEYIIAREKEAEAFFKASLNVKTEAKVRNGEPIAMLRIFNKSDIPYRVKASTDFNIEGFPLGQAVLTPHDTTTFILKAMFSSPVSTKLKMDVNNILVSPDEPLHTSFDLILDEKKK